MARLLVAAVALLLSSAASASIAPREQPRLGGIAYPRPGDPGIRRQTERIGDRIEQGRERGQLSRREARGLKREARQIRMLNRRYGRDGLSDPERRELQARVDYLNGAVSARRTDGPAPGRR